VLLRHFGEDPPERCGNCDNCLDPPRMIDATELARKLLSAVYRTGQSFGIGHVEKVLLGQDDERVRQRGHDSLSVFGIVGEDEARLVRPLARLLSAHEALVATEHGGLALGPAARPILRGEEPVALTEPPERKRRARRGETAPNPVGDPLFEALRAARKELADERGVPPYVIFHDSVLRAMAADRPASLGEMGTISGVGAKKLEAFGDAFLAVIRQY